MIKQQLPSVNEVNDASRSDMIWEYGKVFEVPTTKTMDYFTEYNFRKKVMLFNMLQLLWVRTEESSDLNQICILRWGRVAENNGQLKNDLMKIYST